MFLGTYDGVTELFIQPYIGARDEGVSGAIKGFAKGIVGTPTKFFAGGLSHECSLQAIRISSANCLDTAASGTVGYSLKGVDAAISKALTSRNCRATVSARLAEGEREYLEASEETKKEIIKRWQSCTPNILNS